MKKTIEFLRVMEEDVCLDEIQAIKNEINRLYDSYTKVASGDHSGYYGGICAALDWCEQILEDYDKWKAGE